MNPLPEKDLDAIRGCANQIRGKRVLLTGSEGFLGSWIREALDPICKLYSIDIKNGPEFDITNNEVLGRIITDPVDFIIHTAGYASPKAYKDQPLETISVTLDGTWNLLNLANKFKSRMLFFSSSEVYGNPIKVPTNEYDVGRVAFRGPRACYDESKRLAETICQVYFDHLQTKIVTVRPFNVYGPGMALTDGRAVAAFSRAALSGEEIEVFGSGLQTRTYCYISDAICGFLSVLQFGQAGRVYNIGTPSPEISALALAKKINELAGLNWRIVVRGDTPEYYPADEPMRRCPDISRAAAELNYHPTVELDDGLQRYLSWARNA